MSTPLSASLADGRYEKVITETRRILRATPASLTALMLGARAHFQLGEYDDTLHTLGRALSGPAVSAPREARLPVVTMLAGTLVELGRYDDVRRLVDEVVPRQGAGQIPCGELLLAGAWAAFFEGDGARACELAARMYGQGVEHFTSGRAALCAALALRAAGEDSRPIAYLAKAQHHLEQAQNLFGDPEPVRAIYLVQAQLTRRGQSEEWVNLRRQVDRLPEKSKIAALLRETADLLFRFSADPGVEAAVVTAVGRGVKRPWVAALPGAGVTLESVGPIDLAALVRRALRVVAAPEPAAGAPPARPEGTGGEAAPLPPGEAMGEEPSPAGRPALRRAHPAAPLPHAETPLPPPSREPPARLVSRTRRIRAAAGTVLLVEPSEPVAQGFRTCVADSPYRVAREVANVDQGLETYLTLRPALVVVDLLARGACGAHGTGVPDFVNRHLEIDPHVKLVVIHPRYALAMAEEALRRGARARVEVPFERSRVLDALRRAFASRSSVEALRVPTLELARPVACAWRPLEQGIRDLFIRGRSFIARAVDPMGVEGPLEEPLREGTVVRLTLELEGREKPLHTLAEVVSCRRERAVARHRVRFSFLKMTAEARDRLIAFLLVAASRGRDAGREVARG